MTPTEKVAVGAWVLLFLSALGSSLYQLSRNRAHPQRLRAWAALSVACVVWVVAGVLALSGVDVFTTLQRVGTLVALVGVYFLWSASRGF